MTLVQISYLSQSVASVGREFRDFMNSILPQIHTVQGADAYSEWQRHLKSESPGGWGLSQRKLTTAEDSQPEQQMGNGPSA